MGRTGLFQTAAASGSFGAGRKLSIDIVLRNTLMVRYGVRSHSHLNVDSE